MSQPRASGRRPARFSPAGAVRLALSVAMIVLAAGPAQAVQSLFATFTAVGGNRNVRLVNNGTGVPDNASSGSSASLYSTATGTANSFGVANTRFSFLQGPLAAAVTSLPAWFELNASLVNTPASVSGADIVQGGVSGYFRFLSQGQVVIGTTTHAAGTELLRGDFTLATLTGQSGATNAVFANGLSGTIAYSSDLAGFDYADAGAFQMNFASIASALAVAGSGTVGDPYRAARSFRATATGNFSADNVGAVSAVPEPETWAMLLAGFLLIGFQQRRRARSVIIAG